MTQTFLHYFKNSRIVLFFKKFLIILIIGEMLLGYLSTSVIVKLCFFTERVRCIRVRLLFEWNTIGPREPSKRLRILIYLLLIFVLILIFLMTINPLSVLGFIRWYSEKLYATNYYLLVLYNVLVRRKLEYRTMIWSPYTATDSWRINWV